MRIKWLDQAEPAWVCCAGFHCVAGVVAIHAEWRNQQGPVDADRIQIVNLLMSSLDNARHRYDKVSAQNEELQRRVDELERENKELRDNSLSSR